MFWQEETDRDRFQIPDDVVDLVFKIDCRELPVDHAYPLWSALRENLPWLESDKRVGIHSVHVAGSQNGWERPEHGSGQSLILSRRTKLTIRVPKERLDTLKNGLEGATLEIAGNRMAIGSATVRPLSKQPVMFSRHVAISRDEDEDEFLRWAAGELARIGVHIRKALCGKSNPLHTPQGPILTRSLMVASLTPDESVRLQQHGLGPHRGLGCGLFLPHKGIDAVKKIDEE